MTYSFSFNTNINAVLEHEPNTFSNGQNGPYGTTGHIVVNVLRTGDPPPLVWFMRWEGEGITRDDFVGTSYPESTMRRDAYNWTTTLVPVADNIVEGIETLYYSIYLDPDRTILVDQVSFDILDDNSGDNIFTGRNVDTWTNRVIIHAGAGDDTLSGDVGNDIFYGGDGSDTIIFGNLDNTVDLGITTIQNTGEGWDDLDSIENVNAGAGDDRITGNSFNNIIDGGPGEDTFIVNSIRNNFSITEISPTEFSITDQNGTDTIKNIEYIQFTDSTIRLFNELDALKYIAGNIDLITAFGINTSAATDHYNNFGKSEGRRLSAFNAANYLAKYSDLSSAFGNNETLALKHYIQYGYSEGRTVSSSASNSGSSSSAGSSSSSTTSSPTALSDFQALNYIASNNDLISAFGTDLEAAKSHYINYGKSEGRPVDNFDEWGYLASNNDLMSALGSNTTEAIKHFISYGKSEGRSTTIFNAESYLNNYADLKNAFGNDHILAAKHYVENGFNEGRVF